MRRLIRLAAFAARRLGQHALCCDLEYLARYGSGRYDDGAWWYQGPIKHRFRWGDKW